MTPSLTPPSFWQLNFMKITIFLFPTQHKRNWKIVSTINVTYAPIQINTLRPRQNRRLFADDIFKCIFLNEHVWILIEISLKFVPKGPINNIPASVQIMAWRRPGDKPLSEPMMFSLLTHICVTRPQWVNWARNKASNYFNQQQSASSFTTVSNVMVV